MVAEHTKLEQKQSLGCSLAKISMVAERVHEVIFRKTSCSLAKISMVAEQMFQKRNH